MYTKSGPRNFNTKRSIALFLIMLGTSLLLVHTSIWAIGELTRWYPYLPGYQLYFEFFDSFGWILIVIGLGWYIHQTNTTWPKENRQAIIRLGQRASHIMLIVAIISLLCLPTLTNITYRFGIVLISSTALTTTALGFHAWLNHQAYPTQHLQNR